MIFFKINWLLIAVTLVAMGVVSILVRVFAPGCVDNSGGFFGCATSQGMWLFLSALFGGVGSIILTGILSFVHPSLNARGIINFLISNLLIVPLSFLTILYHPLLNFIFSAIILVLFLFKKNRTATLLVLLLLLVILVISSNNPFVDTFGWLLSRR